MLDIISKLTLKSLSINRRRTFVTLMGIVLSMALITLTANIIESLSATVSRYIEGKYGNYDVSLVLYPQSDDNIERIRLNRNTEAVYMKQDIGLAEFKNSKSEYRTQIGIIAYSDGAYRGGVDFALKEGRYPENQNEIVLSENCINFSENEYKVGDKLTLDVGYCSRYITDENGNEVRYIIPLINTSIGEDEFVKVFTKTYTVTGILEREPQLGYEEEMSEFNSHGVNIYTYTDMTEKTQSVYSDIADTDGDYHSAVLRCPRVYLKINDRTRDGALEFLSGLTGLNKAELDTYIYSEYGRTDEMADKLAKCEFHIIDVAVNSSLHEYYYMSKNIIFYAGAAVIILIMVSGIFIIKNSFSVSMLEKTVLYGKIASVGATPRQIRNSIFFESLILGIIAIPIGLIIGIGGTVLAINISNSVISHMLNGMKMELGISWITATSAVLLGCITIFLSAISPAMRAAEISPIEAVRSNSDIKIKNKKHRFLRCPVCISKLFGVGGEIAWKNMKRSRRQYRTTVISIIVSAAVFISVFSFLNYTVFIYKENTMEYSYNMELQYDFEYIDMERGEDPIFNIYPIDYVESVYLNVAGLGDVEKWYYGFSSSYYEYAIPQEKLSEDINSTVLQFLPVAVNTEPVKYQLDVIAYDDNTYKKIIKKLGYEYDDIKNKAILVNVGNIDLYNNEGKSKTINCELMDDPVGYTINAAVDYDEEDIANGLVVDTNTPKEISIEIGAEITDISQLEDIFGCYDTPELGNFIVSMEWLKNNRRYFPNMGSFIEFNSTNPERTEEQLNTIADHFELNNRVNSIENTYSMLSLVQLFVYGFIAGISLIGITNIINTISTNTKLRQKEYAMLRSVGMTKHEFNRMMLLECLFYTTKSLIIGIPAGLLGTCIVHHFYSGAVGFDNTEIQLPFMFPWAAIIISIVAVTVTVLFISEFSARNVHKQDIVETIRNDNI